MRLNNILPCMAIVLISAGCSGRKETPEKAAIPVSVMTVQSDTTHGEYTYVGTVEETTASMLSFEVGGNVKEMMADAGKQVRKGQTLAILDRTSLKSMHDAALATLNQAQDAYERYKQLHAQGSVPEIQWIEIESKLQQARSTEAIARKRLDDCTLQAPFSGLIAERNVEPGMNVVPGQPVYKLVNVSTVRIKIAVPENEIARIHTGQQASFTVPALDEETHEARITEKGIVANPLSHTYDVKMEMKNPQGLFMPGMVCNVCIWPGNRQPTLIIPPSAVQLDEKGGRFVWLEKNGIAKLQKVATGQLTAKGVVITEGLNSGDHLIIKGNQKVSDGMKVNVQ